MRLTPCLAFNGDIGGTEGCAGGKHLTGMAKKPCSPQIPPPVTFVESELPDIAARTEETEQVGSPRAFSPGDPFGVIARIA